MNIYHVRRTDSGGYDAFSGFVCIAADATAAAHTNPWGHGPDVPDRDDRAWVRSLDDLVVTLLGPALPGSTARVVCASFHAG